MINVSELSCFRCNAKWLPRHQPLPRTCPRCRSPYWNVERKISANSGEFNGNWKGDDVGYAAVHDWVRSKYPKPNFCNICGIKTKKLEASNNSGKYFRDLHDWEYICKKCHTIKDKFSENRMGNKNPFYGKHHTKEFKEKRSLEYKSKPHRNQYGTFFKGKRI